MTMTDTEPVTAPESPPEENKKKSPAGQQARYAAIQRLLANHRDEFTALYEEEAAKRGVRTRSSQLKQKREKLLAELRATEEALKQEDE